MQELIVKKSRFLSQKYSVKSLQEVNKILDSLKKEHKKATHICYAYSFCDNGLQEKCCDDKEPSQTAGKPILSIIHKKELTNTMIVVVRYFGGIKLGAGGLLRAYTKSASLA